MGKQQIRDNSQYHDGSADGFEPLVPLDLKKIHTFDDLLQAYKKTAFGARTLGEAADVLYDMVTDKDCFVVATFSGAMTVAKMGLVICEMIETGMIDAVISTGALMAHGLVEAEGMAHYKYKEGMDDKALYLSGYDRVYDTLELEQNLDDVVKTVDKVLEGLPREQPLCSHIFCREIGRYLKETYPQSRGVLKSAFENHVPVFVPAFTDSELGLDVAIFNRRLKMAGISDGLKFDPFLDLDYYAETLMKQKRLGIFTIGGGVPRNWAQQFAPYMDITAKRLNIEMPELRFNYGVRICPEPVHWGGLSGCTYSEGVSWGKFVPPSEGGKWAEVPSDATLVWPLLIKAVLERLGK